MLMRTDPFRELDRLTLLIPVAEQAKPRKIATNTSGTDRRTVDA